LDANTAPPEQHVREEAERAVREGRDFMTRAIQPGVKKQ
jgi:hypothetical protein